MEKYTKMAIGGLFLIIGLTASGTFARNESAQRTASAGRAPAVGIIAESGRSARTSSGGTQSVAKVWARSGSSAVSGFRGGNNHYYHNFYHGYSHGYHGWGPFWPYWSIGAYVTSLPDDYTTYYVGGDPYYYSDGSYFTPYSSGYMVVPAPDLSNATTAQPVVQASPETEQPKAEPSGPITINIPTSKGGFTPVRLTKSKGGYIGPQGEYYAGHPTVDALRVLYGD